MSMGPILPAMTTPASHARATLVYRLLDKSEWPRLAPLVEREGGLLPSPEFAQAAVAEDATGIIRGYLILQIIPHMEPAYAESGAVNFASLVHLLESSLPAGTPVYTSAPDDHIAALASACGFMDMGWRVMAKVLGNGKVA